MKTHLHSLKFIFCGVLISFSYSVITPATAHAEGFERRRARPEEWNRGRWVHDRHSGRLGWWWVVGPTWNYYERPHSFAQPQTIIVQQAPVIPPPVIVPPPPAVLAPAALSASPVLYYCRATGTHYPETLTCPGGWTTMTATTPPQP